MTLFGALLPRNFFLFLRPGELVLHQMAVPLVGAAKMVDSKTYPLPSPHALSTVLEEVATEFKPGTDDSWFLGLPLKYFTMVNFTLPAAAQANLEQAVQYGLMRHVPYDLSTAYTHYAAQSGDDAIQVAAVVALKSDLRPYLEAVSEAGIPLSLVFPSLALAAAAAGKSGVYISSGNGETELLAWQDHMVAFQAWEGDEEARGLLTQTRQMVSNVQTVRNGPYYLWKSDISPEEAATALGVERQHVHELALGPANATGLITDFAYAIDLVPVSTLKRRRRSLGILAAAFVLFLLALACLPLAHTLGKNHQLADLNDKVETLQQKVNQMSGVRKEYQETVEFMRTVAEYAQQQPLVGELLKELTEILPQDVWLSQFTYADGKVSFQGEGDSATSVLEAVENSPLFQDARFDSQITRLATGGEAFKVIANVE